MFDRVKLPAGRTDLIKRGSFSLTRLKFYGPDGKPHYTYEVRKASTVLKSFDNMSEAQDFQIEKAEKEAAHA